MMKRACLILALILAPISFADWAADRDGSDGYVTVTTLASVIDEAIPFVYVKLSDLPADFHTSMSSSSDTDGKTIRVSTSDGATQLACVPIGVNTGTDTGALFFLGTGMSASSDVDYRIYVGNDSLTMPTAGGGMGEQAVFAAYAGLYFPGVDTRDFTSGGRTLTAVASPGTTASGMEGVTAATYNGTTQYHYNSGTQALTTWPITLECYGKPAAVTNRMFLFGLGTSPSNNEVAHIDMDGTTGGDPVRSFFRGPNNVLSASTASVGFSSGTDIVVVVSRDANTGTSKTYVNGGSLGTDTTSVNTPTLTRLSIGGLYRSSFSLPFDGSVAIAILSSSVRSADFVATQYDNLNGDLYSVGTWTTLDSCNSGTIGWVLLQTAGQSSTADVDWIDITNPLIDDATFAYCTVSDAPTVTEYLYLTNPLYGITPPAGAVSYTVYLRVKGYRGNSSGGDRLYDETIQFIDETGTRIGSNLAKTSEDWTTSATTREYTVTGHTFDGTEFDADTGIAIRVSGADAVGTLDPRVVTAWIRIDWDCGDDPQAKARGFFGLED